MKIAPEWNLTFALQGGLCEKDIPKWMEVKSKRCAISRHSDPYKPEHGAPKTVVPFLQQHLPALAKKLERVTVREKKMMDGRTMTILNFFFNKTLSGGAMPTEATNVLSECLEQGWNSVLLFKNTAYMTRTVYLS